MTRKTHEQFIQEVTNLTGDEFTFLEEYVNWKTKLLCRHNKCGHVWKVSPHNFLHGNRCPNCSPKRKISLEEFLSTITKTHPHIELMGDYVNSSTKTLFKCNICGHEWETIPRTFLKGRNCPICANRSRRKTHAQFLKEVNENNPKVKILSKYQGSNKHVCCECKECGTEWRSIATSIASGHSSCPRCAVLNTAKKNTISNEEFKKRVFDAVGNEYEFLEDYHGTMNKTLCLHKKCGHQYYVRPHDFLINNQRCPRCSKSASENSIEKYLIEHNIRFESQKTFDGLIGTGGGLLMFDFILPDQNILIEFQGEQHDQVVDYWGGESGLEKRKIHDQLKRDFAKNEGYELLEIWYYDRENIEKILDDKLLYQKKAVS